MHLAIAALLLLPAQSVEDAAAAAAIRQAVLSQRLLAIQARLATLPCPPDCGCGCVGGHGCTCTTEFVPVRPVVIPAPRVAAPAVPALPYLPGPRYVPAPPAPIRFAVPAAPVMPRAVYAAPAYAPPVARSNC